MDGRALAKAIAWQINDLRDWPPACPNCGSENGSERHELQVWICADCEFGSSIEMVNEYRQERASREVIGSPSKPVFPLRSAHA